MVRYSRLGYPIQTVEIYTDGCSLNNGRIHSKGGWAYVFVGGVLDNASGYNTNESQGNNRYELHAVNQALKTCLNHGGKFDIVIYTDSHYAINAITLWIKKWRKNGYTNCKGGPVENGDLVKLIDRNISEIQSEEGTVRFVHVEAHKGNYWNDLADKAAKAAAARNPIQFY